MSIPKVYIEIGQLIKQYREKMSMSQAELAEKLGYQSPQFVSIFERGLSKVPIESIGQISVILGIPEKKIKNMLLADFEAELDSRIKSGQKKAAKAV